MAKIYTSSRKPRAKQAEAMAKMRGKDAFALLMSPRVGKSKCIADDYGELELAGRVQNLLIFAPGGVAPDWPAALLEDFSFDLRQRALIHLWKSDANRGELKALDSFRLAKDHPRCLIVNIEAVSSVARCRDLIIEFLRDGVCMVAIDESVTIGNPSSQRTKFILDRVAPLADWRRILSGLPTPRDPLSLWSQFYFLNWRIIGHRSFFSFRARYAVLVQMEFSGRLVKVVKGFRDVEQLNALIEPASYRVQLSDCYDLPERQYAFRYVTMTAEQKRIYKEMKDFATSELSKDRFVTSTLIIAQILRLHQILCGHTNDEQGNHHDIPENRTSELINLLEEEDAEKVVIWFAYGASLTKTAAALEKHFGEGTTAQFWGGNRSTRLDDEARFKTDPRCRCMLATAAAGGRGKEWSIADLVIFHSQSDNWEHRSQAEERTQALGKNRSVSYIDMVVENTVEMKFIQSMRNKLTLSSQVLGDAWRAWLI